ncbi:MAG: ABC transporter ATP-binding protein [Acidobacteriaceae bacterium]|nr:ABC transporter ATP-binding protein [Acidobacteriaceae bacterium]
MSNGAGAPPVFEARGVSYRYRGVAALDGLSMRVERGERVALIGANGSGKSTLIRVLAGLAFAESGQVSFLGEAVTQERLRDESFFFPFRRRVGVLFQNPDVQLFNTSVFDEVAFGPLQLGWPRDEIRAVVERTLDRMGIAHLRNRAPHRLSGGEKKRVALASVLVLDPEVLLLDEPTAALDPGTQSEVVRLLASWANGPRTVITATHDLDTLEEIADRCYVLERGRIAGEGSPMTVLHDVGLLTEAGLLRPQHHKHGRDVAQPHPHAHWGEV